MQDRAIWRSKGLKVEGLKVKGLEVEGLKVEGLKVVPPFVEGRKVKVERV
jgi:hypothetical protein